jgi:hypothetical protein
LSRNAYDAPVLLDTQYDIAFVTWGLIIWLPDICRWAKVVASCRRQALTVSRRSTPVDFVARRSRWPIGADARLAFAGIGALVYDDATTYTGDSTTLIIPATTSGAIQ